MNTNGPYQSIPIALGVKEVRLTQYNVLKFLRCFGPCGTTDIRMRLDAKHGRVYSLSAVEKVCKVLEKKELIKRENNQWFAL